MAQIILNVTLPEALEAYVNERVAEVGYRSPSDYIRTLIREDQERRTREDLDRLLLEGLDSDELADLCIAEDCHFFRHQGERRAPGSVSAAAAQASFAITESSSS